MSNKSNIPANKKSVPPKAASAKQNDSNLSFRRQIDMLSGNSKSHADKFRAAIVEDQKPFSSFGTGAPEKAPDPNAEVGGDRLQLNKNAKSTVRSGYTELRPVISAQKPTDRAKKTVKRKVYSAGQVKMLRVGRILARTAAALVSVALFALLALFTVTLTVTHGPSKTARDAFVLKTRGTVFGNITSIVLGQSATDEIIEQSRTVTEQKLPLEDFAANAEDADGKWANAENGILYETLNTLSFDAYIIQIRDPASVFAGTTDASSLARYLKDNGCVFAVGKKSLSAVKTPAVLAYSDGKAICTDDADGRTFVGFDKNDRLTVSTGMTASEAQALGIRDAVICDRDGLLISSNESEVTVNRYFNDPTRTCRAAIGQCADGSVLIVVTGKSTSEHPGATKNDMASILLDRKAITGALLFGNDTAAAFTENKTPKALGTTAESILSKDNVKVSLFLGVKGGAAK